MVLTEEECGVWLSFIESELGLILPPIQQKRFEHTISSRMRLAGATSEVYLDKVRRDALERQELIDDLAINETQFFRHQPSFEALREYLCARSSEFVRMWSLGCSTGEEAWSLAMIGEELGLNYQVIGTDVSSRALRIAEKGQYHGRKLALLGADQLQTFFDPCVSESEQGACYAVKPSLREKVAFFKHNILETSTLPMRQINVVFCQNVLIYFRGFVQRDILNRLTQNLKTGGLLVLGPSEARSWKHPHMTRYGHSGALAFQRTEVQGDSL